MLIELLKQRTSVRSFTDTPLTDNQIQTLLEAALRSPSSRRIDPWEFIVVTDRNTLRDLSAAKEGAEFISEAAAAIVVIVDITKSDVWIEDCSIAASNIWLTAVDLGLGACWVQIRNRSHSENVSAEAYVRTTLDIPRQYAVEAILGVGHPAEGQPTDGPRPIDRSKIHNGSF